MRIERHGHNIALFIPATAAERRWLRSYTDGTWHNGALVVEMSYANELLAGVQEAGFTAEGDCLETRKVAR